MENESSHPVYCHLNYIKIMKYICFVIMIIGSCGMHGTGATIAREMSLSNNSVAAASADVDESMSKAAATADFDILNANTVDGAPLKGWQCHCWNSTNGLEVCNTRQCSIFFHSLSLGTVDMPECIETLNKPSARKNKKNRK